MTFAEYSDHVKQKGYFSVQLNDHRGQSGLTDEACELVLKKWVKPLLAVCQNSYIYRRLSKNRPYDSTPPPTSPRPFVLSKTTVRTELDSNRMLDSKFDRYWVWALKHANITLCIPKDRFPIEGLAKECWDPTILMNLGTVVAAGSIQLGKREATKQIICSVFSHDSYSIQSHVFAPEKYLLDLYKRCVLNCRFILKPLERDLMPVRN